MKSAIISRPAFVTRQKTHLAAACNRLRGGISMLYIGIDLGTSAVKLLLMDEKERFIKTVSREYPLYFPRPGMVTAGPLKTGLYRQ